MRKLRILLADDHALVRSGIRALLEAQPDIEVVAEADDGREAIRLARDLYPDIAIIDIAMPELNGIDTLRQIFDVCPNIKVLACSMYSDLPYIVQSLRLGACGYLMKNSAKDDLIRAVQAAKAGKCFLSLDAATQLIEGFVRKVDSEDTKDSLTSREREILQLIAEGKSNKEIANKLNLSLKTIETHRTNLMRKLQVKEVTGLVQYAIRKGLIRLTN
ncbi:MAG: response regulator transcription factor [Blastocatellia bacterium]|nr:response regulator transcription factor [Blastocatellia bacterium]MBL8193688.1 response regulator transcription factor [Blastocatellia bacterium]MBN8722884.1 response regulator transcription factor [Acidobacteriota bacterium]